MENQSAHSKKTILRSDQNKKQLISKRVQETKKDINLLRDKLQALIETGLKESDKLTIASKCNDIDQPGTSSTLQNESPSPKINHPTTKPGERSLISRQAQETNKDINTLRSKIQDGETQNIFLRSNIKRQDESKNVIEATTRRNRPYNVDEAREYIRKQREKRAKEAKTHKKNLNVDDLKKQKLQELHKKSLQLVAKNVDAKRSKSCDGRNNPNEIRVDRSNFTRTVRSPSAERVDQPQRSRSCDKSLRNTKQQCKLPQSKSPSLTSTSNRSKSTEKIYLEVPVDENKQTKSKNYLKPPAANITIRSPRNSPESQPNIELEKTKFPIWLQEKHTIQSQPHNFINTVKNKLNLVINSPKITTDIGIQSSLLENRPETPENDPKSLSDLRKLLEKSAKSSKPVLTPLASFASHKVQNLDVKSLKNFELVVNKPSSKSLTVGNNGSESDTSKNIPDISSESGTSLKRNAESVREREDALTVGKIDSMRLKSNKSIDELKSSSISTLKTDSTKESEKITPSKVNRRLFSGPTDSYSSKFSSDEEIGSERRLASSRESIISFNASKSKAIHPKSDSLSSIKSAIPILSENIPETEEISENISNSNSTSKHSSINIPESDGLSSVSVKSVISNPGKGSSSKTAPDTKNISTESIKNHSSSSTSQSEKSLEKSKKSNQIEPLEKPKQTLCTVKTTNYGHNSSKDIHLKFEAEIHLLNDFNESLRQFSAVEKAFESLKTKNDAMPRMETRNTQTSFEKSPSTTETSRHRSIVSTINYSRGDIYNNTLSTQGEESVNISGMLSNYNKSTTASSQIEIMDLSDYENMPPNNFAGLSLIMFEQLIKDEDVKLDNLKTILKIREKALLDRTKSELTFLEIQRKHLKETGRLNEASLIKKKQRGILLKHQQEQHEMRRLKQMQKHASKERKTILKEQWNLIKSQLATENIISKIKVNTRQTRRSRGQNGPLRVLQTHSESIHSEASISRRSSVCEDVFSITSHSQSVISKVSEIESNAEISSDNLNKFDSSPVPLDRMKRTLLMREAVLEKRRRQAEELLQWHRKLLDEEKRISELERLANNVISANQHEQTDSSDTTNKHKFSGKELNQLWLSLTGNDERKFVEEKIYPMSQIALERFCKSAKEYSLRTKALLKKGEVSSGTSSRKSSNDYTIEFDGDSLVEDSEMADLGHNQISSISQLIDNLSKIKEEISLISRKSKRSLRDSLSREIKKKCSVSLVGSEKISTNDELEKSLGDSSDGIATIETDKVGEIVDSDGNRSQRSVVTEEEGDTDEISEEINSQRTVVSEDVTRKSVDIEQLDLELKSDCLDETEGVKEVVSEETEKELTENTTVNTEDLTGLLSHGNSTRMGEEFTVSNREETKLSQSEVESELPKQEMIVSTEEITEPQLSMEIEKDSGSNNENSHLQTASEEIIVVDESNETSISTEASLTEVKTTESSPKEINSYEEKEEDSESITIKSNESPKSSNSEISYKKLSRGNVIDVKKRVSEIMADANQFSRVDKSPRLQDFYVTTYDVCAPASNLDLSKQESPKSIAKSSLGNEAEELLKKQLAIEKEIKQIEQQQKEQLPYMLIREIPNKPPPPYTPPSSLAVPNIITEVPVKLEEIDEITKYSAKILHKAYISNNLGNVSISENTLSLITKKVGKECFKFVFNLCKELAQNHYNQFKEESGPGWLIVSKNTQLATIKPYDLSGLEKHINGKLKEIFKFKKREVREKSIIKWSKKKRDHVDEILIYESQAEEMEWINYDKDELLVMDKVCNDIMNSLLLETANVFKKIFSK